jgi:hypothetical protein
MGGFGFSSQFVGNAVTPLVDRLPGHFTAHLPLYEHHAMLHCVFRVVKVLSLLLTLGLMRLRACVKKDAWARAMLIVI